MILKRYDFSLTGSQDITGGGSPIISSSDLSNLPGGPFSSQWGVLIQPVGGPLYYLVMTKAESGSTRVFPNPSGSPPTGMIVPDGSYLVLDSDQIKNTTLFTSSAVNVHLYLYKDKIQTIMAGVSSSVVGSGAPGTVNVMGAIDSSTGYVGKVYGQEINGVAGQLALTVNEMQRNPVDDGVYGATPYSWNSTLTTNASAYASGNVVQGIISIPTVNFASGRRVTLRSVQLNTQLATSVAFNLYFFKATPSGGTYTDKTALTWGSGDSLNKVGQVNIPTTAFLGDGSTVQQSANIQNLNMKMPVVATTLFALLIIEGAATFATGSLNIDLEFDQE